MAVYQSSNVPLRDARFGRRQLPAHALPGEACFQPHPRLVIIRRFNNKFWRAMLPIRYGIPMQARALICALALLAGGCATNGDPRDPLEPMNRAIYHFNDGFDQLLVKPAAELYTGRMIPEFVRTGLRNFFSNINDVIVAVNDLLQGKLEAAGNDVGRIVINSTAGILGFMDPATDAGLPKNNEDFGQTLGVWGFGDGPYIVLPILGPSSARDTVGWVGDIYTWPITYVKPHHTRNTLVAVRFVGIRADLLAASKVLEAAALDPYIFVRDAYLQRRRNMVYDGRPPPEEEDVEPQQKPGASTEGR
jgi:phospholipid-binding lipoprotein MlaA